MATSPVIEFLQCFRRTALLRESGEQTDGQLLERFVRGRDGVALEALVRRHAPMVWGVCRRALASHHEAEDAFQATFLVLLRKAASIRSREQLANWLYRVAQRTARKARQRAAKRFAREKQVEVMPEPPTEPHGDPFGPELRARLDDELGRLPEKHRIVVVLCDLEGRSRREAARQLRLAEGTVASRLARGRALLARRLIRRGLGASATSLAAVWPRRAASGAVPAALLTRTIKATSLLAAGETAATGLISREVSRLTEAVLHPTGVKKTAGALLVVAALVLAGGMVRYHTLAGPLTSPEAGRVTSPEQPLTGGEEVRRFAVGGTAWSVSFAPDGRQVLVGTDLAQPVRVYDVGSGEEVRRFKYNGCWSAAFSHDGKLIVAGSGDKPTQILDAVTGQVRCQIEYNAGRVRNVTFSPDGRLVASSLATGGLYVLDFAQGKLQRAFPADNNAVHSAAFTPDGTCLLVIDPDHTLRLYEVDSGTERHRFQGHTARVTDVAVSPDGGRALSCSADQTLRLWDLQTGKELCRLHVRDELPHGVAFCPDGRHAVSCGHDKTVRLWDLETGKELVRFIGHEGSVCCVAVSPDGRYALSGSWDRTVRLWRLPDATPAPGR